MSNIAVPIQTLENIRSRATTIAQLCTVLIEAPPRPSAPEADTTTLAQALVATRLGRSDARIEKTLNELPQTVIAGNVLSLARCLPAYVIAADLVRYRKTVFEVWLPNVVNVTLEGGGPKMSLIEVAKYRPNNWGGHALAACAAVGRYLGDDLFVESVATWFRGFLGDRTAYAGWRFGDDLSWSHDPKAPVPINPARGKHDGGIPDDLRRGGRDDGDRPGATGISYSWECMQGLVVAAEILQRAGYSDVWEWSDCAVGRAHRFLVEEIAAPPTGDDRWITWVINRAYGTTFKAESTTPGKNMAWTDWTHA